MRKEPGLWLVTWQNVPGLIGCGAYPSKDSAEAEARRCNGRVTFCPAPEPPKPKPKDVRRLIRFIQRCDGESRRMEFSHEGHFVPREENAEEGQLVEVGPDDLVVAMSEEAARRVNDDIRGDERTLDVYADIHTELERRRKERERRGVVSEKKGVWIVTWINEGELFQCGYPREDSAEAAARLHSGRVTFCPAPAPRTSGDPEDEA